MKQGRISWMVDARNCMNICFTVPGHYQIEMLGSNDHDRYQQLIDPEQTLFSWCMDQDWYHMDYIENRAPFVYDHIRQDPHDWLAQRLPADWVHQWEIAVDDHAETWLGSRWPLDTNTEQETAV
jgi:hypothetical protein